MDLNRLGHKIAFETHDVLRGYLQSDSWQIKEVSSRLLFFTVAEALVLVGTVYHLLNIALKTLPAGTKFILSNIPIRGINHVNSVILKSMDWKHVYAEHVLPLGYAVRYVAAVPLLALGDAHQLFHYAGMVGERVYPRNAYEHVWLGW